ncbi:MAG: hypothetical protein GX626_09790 [Spirochaetales bacterium]|nr:hypothetical protein [Spirochaetales bacterium]
MGKQHQFTSFSLFRAPGFPSHTFPDLRSLHSGLNVVHGPNGVGKTTMVRTMRCLLFASDCPKNLEAEAHMASGGQTWHLSLSQGKLVQKRLDTGEETRLPGRNDEYADAYWFPLHELLESVGSQSVFLQAIQKEMQGGIDLQLALRQAKGIAAFSNGRISLAKSVADAYKAYDDIRKELQANVSLKTEIAQLERELSRQPDLQQTAVRLKTVQAYLVALEKRRALLADLQGYDSTIALLNEHTLKDAQALQAALDQADEAVRQRLAAIKIDQAAFDNLKVAPEFLENPNLVQIITARIDTIKELDNQVRSAEKELQSTETALKVCEEQLSWLVSQIPDQGNLERMVEKLAQLAHTCEPLRCNLAASDTLVRQLGEILPVDLQEKERLESLKATLLLCIETLGSMNSTAKTKPHSSKVLLLGTVALSLLGSLLSITVSPVLGLLGTLAVAVFGLLFSRHKPNEEYQSLQTLLASYQERLEKQLGTFALDSFDVAGLASLLRNVLAKMAELERIEGENESRRKTEQIHEQAKAAYQLWLDEWEQASRTLNLTEEPNLQGSQFFHLSPLLKDWVHAVSAEAQVAANVLQAREQLQAAALDLARLCRLQETKVVDITAGSQNLIHTIQNASKLQDRLQSQKELLVQEKQRQGTVASDLQKFFERLKLASGDLQTLENLQSQYEQYRELEDQKRGYEQSLNTYPPEIVEFAASTTLDEVMSMISNAEAELGQLEELREEYGRKRERYDSLCSDTKLEEALFKYEAAKEALEAQRREEVHERMVYTLFEEVKQESESIHVPQVVRHASNWLLRITANRFSLGMSKGTFTALDTALGRSFSLAELSSGSRVQLLFAVRMAFLQMLESGGEYHFPVFFDELMANSDDQRSMAIAEAIVEISKDRQVFYCTAQLDEVTKLQDVAKGELQVIGLEDEKRSYRIQQSPFSAVKVEATPLIEPLAEYQEYGRALGISAPLLYDPIGSLSSWYLCSDSQELHHLLGRGFSHAGQAARVGEPYQSRLSLMAQAQALARIGRPKILTVHDISDEELKLNRSAAYYESLQVFLQEEHRTGNDVLAAIDAKVFKGFRENARDALASYLFEKGFATDESSHPIAQILDTLCLSDPDLRVDSENYRLVQRYLLSLDLEN